MKVSLWPSGLVLSLVLGACLVAAPAAGAQNKPTKIETKKVDLAVFAGGCFWSMERPFQHVPGVIKTSVGYSGGQKNMPTYREVNSGRTGHAESVEVLFDPSQISYEKLLDVYWHNIDPLAVKAQFCDKGDDYRTVIFVGTKEQERAARASKEKWAKHFKKPIQTEIVPFVKFWPAEDYHQQYADKNPEHYNRYRIGCGRDQRLRQLWGAAASPYVPKH